ncbi:uncharacterized protein N7515_009590 [Penicillium bovifimosum]|uniref:Helicase ATP-binding domain-containing protein n=1 Tax=Penicillium bovifimosum TaxID=126998 RepID=A0A9W9KVU5_9EURO|nr:uncharacterized protein N7515_009590 [Penicillium bovifimosum]KAJ5121629.1 hypothetical protein N7515_009590 [Penicillium bovifimosum]
MRPSSVFPNNARQDERAEAAQEDDEDGMSAEQWMGHVADLQAAHSSHVAGMIYGRGITDWHRFLGFVSADDGGSETALGLAPFSPWQKEAELGRTERRWRLSNADMETEMQRMMGNGDLRLRGVQRPALEAIQHGHSPVLAVMSTGGGKSMLFLLLAWITPRGATLGISCVAWESRRPADHASIVLVTPESAVQDDFMDFLDRLRLCLRLDRIVIDECHMVLSDNPEFRPTMAQLGRLVVAQAQMVYLTATLPLAREDKFFVVLQTSREKVHYFRARTNRLNVAYRLWHPTEPIRNTNSYGWVEVPEIACFIKNRIARARAAAGRVVIYGPTLNVVDKLAALVGCEAYHRKTIAPASTSSRGSNLAPSVTISRLQRRLCASLRLGSAPFRATPA